MCYIGAFRLMFNSGPEKYKGWFIPLKFTIFRQAERKSVLTSLCCQSGVRECPLEILSFLVCSFILLFVPVLSSVTCYFVEICENLASLASMCACAVATCPNYHRKTKSKGVMYHMFPVCPNRNKIWISKCKRQDHINVKYARICSDHFRPSDYMDDMKNRLLGLNQKKILKPDAVPSVNLPLQNNREDISSRSERKRKRNILREAKIRLKCLSPKKACEADSFSGIFGDRGDLVVRSRLWSRRVPKPDSTEDPSCSRPVAR
ncbi:hypothetical protein AVEN_14654-1 [Araneus ventricosus]|uniref:THAP-type domain-containing protein n=1 Tax=Araneus ventricosus TaxID=182803 RepID=A0A4Y2PKL2_ARAVE|nr:hypothetical protein AVEN_178617-1 [Araneus ventricosus]GBN52505.1 hypothetical protein AVEN_14654-1 [Araneus ventricosus]